jgi:hypothetical protein
MLQISISFDPHTDDADTVTEAVQRIFDAVAEGDDAAEGEQETFRAGEQAAHAAATGNLSVTDTDTEGFTWDARIHSTPAKKTEKGVWRAKRGADPQLVAQVKAAQIAARTTAAPVNEPAAPVNEPAAPVNEPAAPAMPPATPTPYAELIGVIGRHTYDAATNPTGRINADWVTQYLTNWGVPGGMVENVATMDVGVQSQIVSAFKQALGE